MNYIAPWAVCEGMNILAKAKTPFLMGVDFELTRGFLVENPLESQEIFFSLRNSTSEIKNTPQRTPKKPKHPHNTNSTKNPNNAKDAKNSKNSELSRAPGGFSLTASPESLDAYAEKFKVVKTGLERGDSYLVNLTLKTPIECSLSLEEIFLLSEAPFSLYIPGDLVCFSPERFVSISGAGEISTFPMKGTINAAIKEAERIILDDFKESAEHATVVDLLRNDLSLSASKVRVERYRYIDHVKTSHREILQVSSDIRGELGPDYYERLGDIIFRMLPAGSVSGAPKESTLDIIRRSEGIPRGFYTGIFGFFDGQGFDSGVLIRYIEEQNSQKYFRSGGGITAYSSLEDEYKEAIEKIYLPLAQR
jgi:para-aminobenzoate synthetase component 1